MILLSLKKLNSSSLYLFVVFLASCNSVFYQPSEQVFLTPDQIGLNYDESIIETKDQESLISWVITAPNRRVKANIIQFHGNGENQSSHFRSLAWLANYGFRLITFDYRGYGGSSGYPNRVGLVIDGTAVINHVCQRFSEPTILIGQSLGGAVSIPSLALSEHHCIKLLVVDSSFSSYRSIAAKKIDQIPVFGFLSYPLSFLVTDDYSPIHYVSKLDIPILFVHGKGDGIVPYDEGLALYRGSNSKLRTLWSFHNSRHIEVLYGMREKSRNDIAQYFYAAIE